MTNDDTLEELKVWYRESLKERIESFQEPIARFKAGSEADEKTIRQLAHSLRGSGATYGFPGITDAAGAVEDAAPSELGDLADKLIDVLAEISSEG